MTCQYSSQCSNFECDKLCNIEYTDCYLYQDFEKYRTRVEVTMDNGKLVTMIKHGLEMLN